MLISVPYGAYFIFGSFNFTMAILAYWVPETKGVSSPERPSLFFFFSLSFFFNHFGD